MLTERSLFLHLVNVSLPAERRACQQIYVPKDPAGPAGPRTVATLDPIIRHRFRLPTSPAECAFSVWSAPPFAINRRRFHPSDMLTEDVEHVWIHVHPRC